MSASCSPVMISSSVVLPAPLGPTMAIRRPALICSETSPNRCCGPNALPTPDRVTRDMAEHGSGAGTQRRREAWDRRVVSERWLLEIRRTGWSWDGARFWRPSAPSNAPSSLDRYRCVVRAGAAAGQADAVGERPMLTGAEAVGVGAVIGRRSEQRPVAIQVDLGAGRAGPCEVHRLAI